jgi:hypothetical protein
MRLVIFNRTETDNSGPRPGRLVYQVVDRGFMMYNISVMDVPHNTTLTTGLFANFKSNQIINPVTYTYQGPDWPHRSETGPFQQDMRRMIHWCAEHTTDEFAWWHFDMYVTSVSTVTATFYFSNDDTALEFKLACL